MAGHLRLVKPAGPKEPKKRHRRTATFSPEETARLRAALKHAHALLGSWPCLADALRMSESSVRHAASGSKGFSGDVAVRLARALGKPLETLYRAPTDASACPTCGAKRGAR